MSLNPICKLINLAEGKNQIESKGIRYLVSKEDQNIQVFSAVCPHQGGKVCLKNNEYICPLHNWKFSQTGNSLNAKHEKLHTLNSEIVNGEVLVPNQIFSNKPFFSGERKLNGIELKLLSHACVMTEISGLKILTDPWLDGPAFYGAWIQYPKYKVDIPTLSPDIIIITHEHSDHFHPRSLVQFSKTTKIVFPEFPNERIEKLLRGLGFKNIHGIPFGQEHLLSSDVKIKFFEPLSVWNDSIVLLQTPQLNILNLNDAGLNYQIKSQLPPIDLVMCQFNAGASSYPATWNNISDKDKKNFYLDAVDGKIEMIKQVMELYEAQFLLPFASFFGLWNPEHKKYMDMSVFCPPYEIKEILEKQPFDVLDLLPGDSWLGDSSTFMRFRSESSARKTYNKSIMLKNLEREFTLNGEQLVNESRSNSNGIDSKKIIQYFHYFNSSPEISNCEDLTILLTVQNTQHLEYFKIEIKKSNLKAIQLIKPCSYELSIKLPWNILNNLISSNNSWDEAHIGYWCEFDRNPDVYHVGFWRMIQAPYFLKNDKIVQGFSNKEILGTPIIKLFSHSARVDKILSRYGLHCFTCSKQEFESLEMAIQYHGLSDSKKLSLINELLFIINRSIPPQKNNKEILLKEQVISD